MIGSTTNVENRPISPEEALQVQESLVGWTIPSGFEAFGAGLMVIMTEAAASDCACKGCTNLREFLGNIDVNSLGGLL